MFGAEREVPGREIGDGRSAALPVIPISSSVFYYSTPGMTYTLDRSAHSVFALRYHLVVVVKYRRKALYSSDIRERLKDIVWNLSTGFGYRGCCSRTSGGSFPSPLQGNSENQPRQSNQCDEGRVIQEVATGVPRNKEFVVGKFILVAVIFPRNVGAGKP